MGAREVSWRGYGKPPFGGRFDRDRCLFAAEKVNLLPELDCDLWQCAQVPVVLYLYGC